jgi:predicted RNase H-like nuclease
LGLGVDGCRAGWFAVALDGDAGWHCSLHGQIADLAEAYPEAERILIDMPIGLPADRRRECDSAARRLLGRGRASSIFPVPCRAVLEAADYAQACALNASVLAVKISPANMEHPAKNPGTGSMPASPA